ncbi:cytochrome P450 [Lasiodiplodia theobromae]|uniref:Averantin hydroxylase n=1 Tax=Lasiodiplodia theobromae TaxID=45133 RepID=A0A5N5D596_9PEZI|nr:Averantin hydroxylase [Lasiodiplodia theobromae]KAF9638062.1 cytochrome P450 [Lasiodiplodia theobromae]
MDSSLVSVALGSAPRLLLVSAVAVLVFYLGLAIRRLWFHPLAKYPGPRLAAITNVPYSIDYLSGRQPYRLLKLHEKYGPIVRIAPNELSFSTAQSWKDIYGPRKGHHPFVKAPFYDGNMFSDMAHSIASECDPAKHAVMRKYLANAFTERSLREQEAIIGGHVDAFISKIGELGSAKEGIDLTRWFHLLTLDIIGDLAFGQSFGGIESGKTNSWIEAVIGSMGQFELADTFGRFPWVGKALITLNRGAVDKLLASAREHQAYTVDLIKKRLARDTGRKDFITCLLEGGEGQNQMSEIELAAHSSDFVIAGSETTATTLAVVVFYLCKDPSLMEELQREVRSSFDSYESINSTNTARLRYLHAVCQEALRICPPVPLGLPRIVPPGGDTVDGQFLPQGTVVSTHPLAATLSETNFADPWKFDPQRWLSPDNRDCLEASQPFSLGTRVCIGRALGLLELRTVLSKMLFKYSLSLVDPTLDWHKDVEMHVLWKKPSMRVKVEPI